MSHQRDFSTSSAAAAAAAGAGGRPGGKPTKSAKKPKHTVFYRYKDKNRLLYYYYDPVAKTTVWETPRGAIVKDGKTNKVLSRTGKKKSQSSSISHASSSSSSSSSMSLKASYTKSTASASSPPSIRGPSSRLSIKTSMSSTALPRNSSETLKPAAETVWRSALCGDEGNLRQYFYMPGSGERAWSVPPSAWDSKNGVEAYPRAESALEASNDRRNRTKAVSSGFDISELDPVVGARFLADQKFLEILRSVPTGDLADNGLGSGDDLEKRKDAAWIVRMHIATGQFYYVNKATGHQQWNNPFDRSGEVEDEREQAEQDVDAAVEMLVGKEFLTLKAHSEVVPCVPPGDEISGLSSSSLATPRSSGTVSLASSPMSSASLRSSPRASPTPTSNRSSMMSSVDNRNMISVFDHTRDCIQEFVDENRLAFTGPRASARLAFPEYVDPHYIKEQRRSPGITKIPFAVSGKVRIRIFKPVASRQASQQWATEYNTIVVSPEATVGEVTATAISKCSKGNIGAGGVSSVGGGTSVSSGESKLINNFSLSDGQHSESSGRYVLKAMGSHSFLVHLEYPLIWYQCVQNALRECEGKLKEKSMIQLCLIYLSPAEAEQVKLIRSTLRADVPECSPEEQAMVLEKVLNFIETAKEVDVEDAFQSVCRMLIKHVGAALTRRYAFAVRALICERVRGHALRGPSKVMARLERRDRLTKCPVGLLDWDDAPIDRGSGHDKRIFQDARRERFSCEHWIEKMSWPLRIYLRGMENVSARWTLPVGKESSRSVQVQHIDVVVGLYNNGELIALKNGRGSKRTSMGSTGFAVGTSGGDGGSGSSNPARSRQGDGVQVASAVVAVNNTIHWTHGEQCLEFFGLQLCDLPSTTRLGFTLRGYVSDGRIENLAAGSVTLLDARGHLRQGSARVDFWLWHQQDRSPMNPGTVVPAGPYDSQCSLNFEFDRFPTPIVAAPLRMQAVLCASPGTAALLSGLPTLTPESESTTSTSMLHSFSMSSSQRNMIRLGGSHTSSARQVVATLSGVCETADEADLEAAMLSERHAEAFLVAQKVSQEFPELSLAEKRAKVVMRLPSGVMSEATESVVRNELTWTDSDDAYLETFSRLTPLDDDQLLRGAEGKPGEMSPRDWIWAHRYHCCAVSSKMLAKFLKVVDWGNHNDAREAREVMSRWYVERPEIALELLGQSFSDPIVRAYAVHHLSSMKDDDLQSYMLQLVQCLKFEQHDNSVLLRFMLRRALRDPLRVGASMFWLLRSELHNRETLGRYGLLLELYVRNCGPHREVLGLIHETVAELERVTKLIVTIPKKDRARRTTMAREELARIAWPKRFGTCLTSLHMCSGILIDRCKVMDSKQAPLWIEFANADSHGSNIKVMFKVGDDLRQDQMTLQFLELLDRKSLRTGVDLCMRPYKCVGTGREVGMVEMVPISDTIARMQWAGGGPYDKKPLYDFLLANAKLKTSAVQDAVRAFTQSCAGYTVATYVMGIGDRHPSNIMMQEDGHLFHIDFGHFLGNFKQKKVGIIKIDRERSPVVFTPQMLHVLNPKADKFSGEQVERFLGVCYSTYSLLRDRASEFITLFTLMVTAGLPELKHISSVSYMQKKLRLRSLPDKKNQASVTTDDDANAALKTEIQSAVKTSSKQLDDWMHMKKHKDGATDGSQVLFDFYEEMRKANKKPPLYWMK